MWSDRHPDKAVGDEKDDANERFQVLQRAKQVLTDPELRRNYDAWRRAGISISFKDWMGNKNATFMVIYFFLELWRFNFDCKVF